MSKGKNVGYVRVSTEDQNTARQLDGVALDKIFEDKASGKNTDRPRLAAAIDYLREDDTLHVHSMDRLARNVDDLRKIVKDLTSKGVVVRFHKENLIFTGDDSPMSNLLLTMLGAVAEFERSLIRERQREGIAKAKQRGVYRGRSPELDQPQIEALKAKLAAGAPKAAVAREFGIGRATLYRYLAA